MTKEKMANEKMANEKMAKEGKNVAEEIMMENESKRAR